MRLWDLTDFDLTPTTATNEAEDVNKKDAFGETKKEKKVDRFFFLFFEVI